jgi:hypothetical protein
MGRYHLRCKNRFLYYYVSVSLLRVGDKLRFYKLNSRFYFIYFIYFICCPKLDQ